MGSGSELALKVGETVPERLQSFIPHSWLCRSQTKGRNEGRRKSMGGKWEDKAAVVSVAAVSGGFFSPLNGPVRPVPMMVPLGMSHQLGRSERRRGAAAASFPHKPAAARCENKPWSARRPSIVGSGPGLRKQGGDAGARYCCLPSHASHFASAE